MGLCTRLLVLGAHLPLTWSLVYSLSPQTAEMGRRIPAKGVFINHNSTSRKVVRKTEEVLEPPSGRGPDTTFISFFCPLSLIPDETCLYTQRTASLSPALARGSQFNTVFHPNLSNLTQNSRHSSLPDKRKPQCSSELANGVLRARKED